MGASLCRDGCGLPSKCSTVRENSLLRDRASVPSRGGLRRAVGVRDRGAASESVSSCCLWRLLPRNVCRNSARQVPQQPPPLRKPTSNRGHSIKSPCPTCQIYSISAASGDLIE